MCRESLLEIRLVEFVDILFEHVIYVCICIGKCG